MGSYRLRHFTNLDVLRAIEPSRLIRFLEPFRSFFAARGYALPPANAAGEVRIDYPQLVNIFLAPKDDSPRELLDALFLVDEMSTPEGMDELMEASGRERIVLDQGDDHSPADIAVQVWLRSREILERKHAQQFLLKPRTFEYYQAQHAELPLCGELSASVRQMIERDLDDWFESKKRGRGTRVFDFPDEQKVGFLVRHGEPFKREESLTNTAVSSVCYRPLKYDVVIYDRQLGELRINASSVRVKALYREVLGKYLFGDRDCFPGTVKYTLQPLRELGAEALACEDIEGLESIALTEIHWSWGGVFGHSETHKATDVLAALGEKFRRLPELTRLIKAVFRVKFTDSKTPRSVKIRPGNIAEYTRDSDAELVEQWLARRGFLVRRGSKPREAVA